MKTDPPNILQFNDPRVSSLGQPSLQYEKGTNKSGLHPLGRAVLLWPIQTGFKTDKILLPEHIAKQQLAFDTVAWVVEMGPDCDQDSGGIRCHVGDKIIVARMSGSIWKGRDGVFYRAVNHRDIYMGCDADFEVEAVNG